MRFLYRAVMLPVTIFLVTATTALSQTETTAAAQKKLDLLANLQRHLTDMNSPGVQLFLKEIDRNKIEDRTIVRYDLYATGLPKDGTYNLFTLDFDGSVQPVSDGITLDSAGQAICAGRPGTCKGEKTDDPIHLAVFAARGEPKRFALMAASGKHKLVGFIQVIPFPDIVVDGDCRLERVLGLPNSEVLFVQGTGFKPKAVLTIVSRSGDENITQQQRADDKGAYFTALLPYVEGKSTGQSSFEVKSASCNAKILYSWGEGTYHPE